MIAAFEIWERRCAVSAAVSVGIVLWYRGLVRRSWVSWVLGAMSTTCVMLYLTWLQDSLWPVGVLGIGVGITTLFAARFMHGKGRLSSNEVRLFGVAIIMASAYVLILV